MPALFIGHGTPTNAVQENRYTLAWQQLGRLLPRPRAIVVISAHWLTDGNAVTASSEPATLYDFHGFPQALYEVRYPAPGAPALAAQIAELLAPLPVQLDQHWGLDHGAWSVLCHLYPAADIPVLELSLDRNRDAAFHFELGARLAALRRQGVLLLGSGNVVHNLRRMARGCVFAPYGWALEFNQRVRAVLQRDDLRPLTTYADWGEAAHLAVPTTEHLMPLMVIAGSHQPGEPVTIATDGIEAGSIGMLSAVFGQLEGLASLPDAA
jgi:4,5-DOPA dioxygenase extradiol